MDWDVPDADLASIALSGPAAYGWLHLENAPPLVVRLGKKELVNVFRHPKANIVTCLPLEDEGWEMANVFGATLSKAALYLNDNGSELKEMRKWSAMLAKEGHLFCTSIASAKHVPKFFDLMGEINHSTGSCKGLFLCLGESAPLDVSTTSTIEGPLDLDDARINSMPLGIFGRGDEQIVGALMRGRQLDLTGTADAPLVSFTREQWPNLVMRSVSGIEELVELLGSTFIPHLVSFLLKWKPLSALKTIQAWGAESNVIAFVDKWTRQPYEASPLSGLSKEGRAFVLQLGRSYALKHSIENKLATKETKGKVAARYLDFTRTMAGVVDTLKTFPSLFHSAPAGQVTLTKLIKELDELKPELATTSERVQDSDRVLDRARNSAEAKDSKDKRKGTHASPGQRRSTRRKEKENEPENEEMGEGEAEGENEEMDEGEAEGEGKNLASLMAMAAAPPATSKGTTLLAMHAAQSSALKSVQSDLETERTEHRRTLEEAATVRVQLAAKTAELETVREAMAQYEVLRRQLEQKEGERAAAVAQAAEKEIRIKELKKQSARNQAIFLAMSSVNHASFAQFMEADDED